MAEGEKGDGDKLKAISPGLTHSLGDKWTGRKEREREGKLIELSPSPPAPSCQNGKRGFSTRVDYNKYRHTITAAAAAVPAEEEATMWVTCNIWDASNLYVQHNLEGGKEVEEEEEAKTCESCCHNDSWALYVLRGCNKAGKWGI